MSPEQNTILASAMYRAQAKVAEHIRNNSTYTVERCDWLANKFILDSIADIIIMESVAAYDASEYAEKGE